MVDTPHITNDETFTTGDFEVVTSDNVLFRVPSVLMFAASPVWNDASSIATDKRLTFPDKEYETAPVFRLFLSLAKDGTLTDSDMAKWNTRKLVLFLQKWECTALLKITLVFLREFIRRPQFTELGGNAAAVFWTAAQADDLVTCTAVLELFPLAKWTSAPAGMNCDSALIGASCWNPLGWSRKGRQKLPELYTWALSRAFLAVGATKVLGDTFRAYYLKAETQDDLVPKVGTEYDDYEY